jgi:hypothetical protein
MWRSGRVDAQGRRSSDVGGDGAGRAAVLVAVGSIQRVVQAAVVTGVLAGLDEGHVPLEAFGDHVGGTPFTAQVGAGDVASQQDDALGPQALARVACASRAGGCDGRVLPRNAMSARTATSATASRAAAAVRAPARSCVSHSFFGWA